MIELYDTTLRDGTQGEGISLTVQDKLRIAAMLDEFGIHLIEGGWPGSNPKDIEFFRRVRSLNLKNAQIAAFGSTCRPSRSPDTDDNLRALLDSQAPVATIFGKSRPRDVTRVLRTELDHNLKLIGGSVAFLKAHDLRVIYDAEHFFDAFAADAQYALQTLKAAADGGADTLVLCDTNGGTMPWTIQSVTQQVAAAFDAPLGIHAHNDGGCAVANSLLAVQAGASHVQGTINGIGERCGNADLGVIAANLQFKTDSQVLPDDRMVRLTELSRGISEICNRSLPGNAPYVGRSAFAHKGGVHVAALRRDPGSYEHVQPERVGNHTRILVSELSGRGNIGHKAEEFGIQLDAAGDHGPLLSSIKDLENRGFSFEAAEASVEMMMRRLQPDYRPFFELIDFMVVVEHRQHRGHLAEANVKIRIDNHQCHTAAEGTGPVNALDAALRKALTDAYPVIETFHLTDYKVRILNGECGTSAITRVLIDFSDGKTSWSTVGASANIIEATWQALFDSFEFGLFKAGLSRRDATIMAESA